MDKLVIVFQAANPDFVSTYDAARRITDPPTTTTQLKGVVTDQQSGAPVAGATVTVTPPGEGGTPLNTRADDAGKYLFKPLPEGNYAVKAAADGYEEFRGTVRVYQGEINHCDIEMTR